MRCLLVPTLDDRQVYNAIAQAKQEPRRSILVNVRENVFNAYRLYMDHAPALEALPVLDSEEAEREALVHAYTSETQPLSRMKSELTAPVSTYTCPFCGLSESSTLDHYLPKEQFPHFAVFAKNLIPCCGRCNTLKNDVVLAAGTNVRSFVHPYFDSIPEVCFVSVAFTMHESAISFEFSVFQPDGMPDAVFHHLEAHFRVLGLAGRYRKMTLDHLRDRLDNLQQCYGATGDAAIVASQLLRDALSNRARYGPNYWRTVLYMTLANHAEFCDGGFRLLGAIQ